MKCIICEKDFVLSDKQKGKLRDNNYIPCCSNSCSLYLRNLIKKNGLNTYLEKVEFEYANCPVCGISFKVINKICCSRSCSTKYGHLNDSINNRAENISKSKQGKSHDYWINESNKRRANKTDEELQEIRTKISTSVKTYQDNLSDEQKAIISEQTSIRISENYKNNPDITERKKKTWKLKSEQELKAHGEKAFKWYTDLSDKEKKDFNEKNSFANNVERKYGVRNISQIDSYLRKIQISTYNTKKKNGTLGNKSLSEDYIAKKLSEKFESYKDDYSKSNKYRQYKSDEYPYACDFYIPELDLYLEYHGNWTHGYKSFTNSDSDLKLVQKWKNRYEEIQKDPNNSFTGNLRTSPGSMYLTAIETFTKVDPKKREIAEQNNLNYLTFYNIEEFESWFNSL